MRVYLDQVFVLNLCVNYLLLRGTARLGASAVPGGGGGVPNSEG